MIFDLDFSNPLILIGAVVLIFLVIDLFAAGGGMTGGMMGGMAGMMGTPWGGLLTAIFTILIILLIFSNT